MNIATFQIVGISDLMFGAHVSDPKLPNETEQQKELRLWTKKVRVDKHGQALIQPFAIKNALESSGKWLSMKIPGEGKKTYTDRLKKGVLATDPILLHKDDGTPLTIDDIEPRELFVPSSGKRGEGKRVTRIFPTTAEWNGEVKLYLFDDMLTIEVLERHLITAGQFIGLGSMRVEGGGINGRFEVADLKYEENAAAA